MATKDKYEVNWSSHTYHMKRAFENLLKASDFADVTLSCEGKKLKAHRMILSSCSVYFHELLMDNLCSHPIIILRDVDFESLQSILQFMYLGEVQVPTVRFSAFLKTAELLKISGLSEEQEDEINEAEVVKHVPDDISEPIVKPEFMKPGPASKKAERMKAFENRKRVVEEATEEKTKMQQPKRRKSLYVVSPPVVHPEPVEPITAETEPAKPSDSAGGHNATMVATATTTTSQNIANVQKLLSDEAYLSKEANPENECPICANKFSTMYLLKQHIPYHLGETKCQYCDSVFSRKDLLRKHLVAVHKILVK